MLWFIIIIFVLIKEFNSGELWTAKAVRNFGIIVLLVVFAQKNPGGALMLAVVGVSVFLATALYRADCMSEKAKRKRASSKAQNVNPFYNNITVR